jgi:hypothetical protein
MNLTTRALTGVMAVACAVLSAGCSSTNSGNNTVANGPVFDPCKAFDDDTLRTAGLNPDPQTSSTSINEQGHSETNCNRDPDSGGYSLYLTTVAGVTPGQVPTDSDFSASDVQIAGNSAKLYSLPGNPSGARCVLDIAIRNGVFRLHAVPNTGDVEQNLCDGIQKIMTTLYPQIPTT